MNALLLPLFCFTIFRLVFSKQSYFLENLKIDIDEEIEVNFIRGEKSVMEIGITGNNSQFFRENQNIQNCEGAKNEKCFTLGKTLKFRARKEKTGDCVLITGDFTNEIKINYKDYNWYGGPVRRWYPEWPVQKQKIQNETFTIRNIPYRIQVIAESYWINSKGASVYIYPESALHIDSNNRQKNFLFLYANNSLPPYNEQQSSILKFEVCTFENPVQAHKNAVDRYLGKPKDIPDENMLKYPSYDTYGLESVNKTIVENYVNQTLHHKFKISSVALSYWENCTGKLTFDEERFPEMKNLTDELHNKSIKVLIDVKPFIRENCLENEENERFVKDKSGKFIHEGKASYDFTNQTTADWWVEKVKKLLETNGIDSVKSTEGGIENLPNVPVLSKNATLSPNNYVTKYTETFARLGKNKTIVTYGSQNQRSSSFIRPTSHNRYWGAAGGLRSTLISLLQMNMNGYVYTSSSYIGGLRHIGSSKPEKELFIRWLQAVLFMPSLTFSTLPWEIDEETVEITRKMLAVRENHFDMILKAVKKASIDGTPVNPPLWWIAPKDREALKCNDEYLLGETLLVAPVIEDEGVRSRDIYLPKGGWIEHTRKPHLFIEGPRWLRNYSVALDELPYFIKVNNGCKCSEVTKSSNNKPKMKSKISSLGFHLNTSQFSAYCTYI